jgi:hypothetical protein
MAREAITGSPVASNSSSFDGPDLALFTRRERDVQRDVMIEGHPQADDVEQGDQQIERLTKPWIISHP